MAFPKDEHLKELIAEYQQKIFSLVLYLVGDDKDKVYEITVASFVDAIEDSPWPVNKDIFLVKLTASAVKKTKDVKSMPSLDDSDFLDIPPEKRKSLQITKEALQSLPYDVRLPLLLRDQVHLSYKGMASILRMSEKNVKIVTPQARVQLRTKIEEILKRA